ncbi:hypothetical protein NDU88_005686 [Pleurodeles waltl]|uniref:Uncharacterized protein n=1 Tax=Pleurodeles waltl TaxID=8319 RepID=A0AAV7MA49_PLEWA|nr:hypothetical protein NDU88_005686 [Pleurodeles waltl]
MATTRTPETAEECPGGTHWEDGHPEVVHDPDIQRASTLKELEPEERGEREPETREVAEPEEEENTEPEDEAGDPEKRRNIDLATETPTEANERRDRTRHVPGGAWLTQV